jgi:hypothetical protein
VAPAGRIEQVSILLSHSDIKVTQQHYNPCIRDRQLQLQADLQRAWNRDPVVLLYSKMLKDRATDFAKPTSRT